METMRDRFHRIAAGIIEDDPRSAVVLADIGTGAFAAAMERHPDRAINVGIREQLQIGVTAGLALAGYRPVAYSYTPFVVERPFEQIKLDLGHNDLGAVIVSTGASYDASGEGRTHQAPEDVALIASLPGWAIHAPGHPDELERHLRAEMAADGRAYIRMEGRSNREPRTVGDGRMLVERRGARATIVAVGPTLDPVLEAVSSMDVTVLYATTVRPFDAGTLRSELVSSDVVIVEPYLEGTSAAAVSEALLDTPHRLLAIGVGAVELRRYGRPEEHERAHGLDVDGLRRRIGAFIEREA